MLCNHHRYQGFRTFSSPQREAPTPLSYHCAFSLSPSPWKLFIMLYPLWVVYGNRITQYGIFCIWFLLLSIMFLRLIYVVECVSTSFFYGWIISNYIIYHISFICLSVDGPVGCFHFLVVGNSAAINIHVQVFCGHTFPFHLGIYLRMELLGLWQPCLTFWRTAGLFLKQLHHFIFPLAIHK